MCVVHHHARPKKRTRKTNRNYTVSLLVFSFLSPSLPFLSPFSLLLSLLLPLSSSWFSTLTLLHAQINSRLQLLLLLSAWQTLEGKEEFKGEGRCSAARYFEWQRNKAHRTHTPTGHFNLQNLRPNPKRIPKSEILQKFEAILFTRNSLKYAFIIWRRRQNRVKKKKSGRGEDWKGLGNCDWAGLGWAAI